MSVRPPRGLRRTGWALRLGAMLLGAALLPTPVLHADVPPDDTIREAPEEAYRRHLTNGVRLFASDDFRAAIVQFRAAYAAVPGPSPLINEALAHQKLRDYPAAVAKLEQALHDHRETMTEEDVTASEQTIEQMRALFAYVTIRVIPDGAVLSIDGAVVPGPWDRVPVSPGTHDIRVERPGYVAESRQLSVVSADRPELSIELREERGSVRVVARQPTTAIIIDGKEVGSGSWEGQLTAGEHLISLQGETGTGTVLVAPSGSLVIDESNATRWLPPLPSPPAEASPDDRRGLYGGANGAVLFPTRHPNWFGGAISSGGYVGVRGGYRVHELAGFEGMFEYGNIVGPANGVDDNSYSWTTLRFAPVLRLMSPGDWFYFVGTLGGGLSINFMEMENDRPYANVCHKGAPQCDTTALNFFVMTEAGVEFDIDGVLVGVMAVAQFTGTKNIKGESSSLTPEAKKPSIVAPYDNEVLPLFGPRIFIGYAFW